ncbi:MAG TPA: hypothetical protein ENH82_13855 [bacterium]|nr:hypothetical protein [bacterium]
MAKIDKSTENPVDRPVKINFVKRLTKAIQACRVLSESTNKKTDRMLRSYASGFYKGYKYTADYEADPNTTDPHPINMIDRAVGILLPYLVGGNQTMMAEPRYNLEYKPFAHTFQQALNQQIRLMKLAVRTLEPAVLNSLFSMGITKTGTKKAGTLNVEGYLSDYGSPFSEVVDRSNYVYDITAKDREQYEFEGDSYYLPTEVAKELFDKHADMISPDFKMYGEGTRNAGPKTITNPEKVAYNELHEYSEFIDVWLPKEKLMITVLPPHKDYNMILRRVQYDGPESGPYDVLAYKSFPESTIPIPPIYTLMELDAAINTLFSKARNQAERTKKLGVFEAGGEEDARTARDAKDGDFIGLNNVQNTREVTLGGVIPEIYPFLGFSLQQFSEQGGNLNTTGGRTIQAETLGQEELLMANAGRQLNMMSQKVHNFASSIGEKLAYEMWNNPTLQMATITKAAGIVDIPILYDQTEQQGRFTDYELDIQMYSMQRATPEQKFTKMMQLLNGWILPTAQLAAQQGKILNIPEVTKDLSNYIDLDTESWFLSDTPQSQSITGLNAYQPQGAGGGDEALNLNNSIAKQNAQTGKTTAEV